MNKETIFIAHKNKIRKKLEKLNLHWRVQALAPPENYSKQRDQIQKTPSWLYIYIFLWKGYTSIKFFKVVISNQYQNQIREETGSWFRKINLDRRFLTRSNKKSMKIKYICFSWGKKKNYDD